VRDIVVLHLEPTEEGVTHLHNLIAAALDDDASDEPAPVNSEEDEELSDFEERIRTNSDVDDDPDNYTEDEEDDALDEDEDDLDFDDDEDDDEE
jgi:hypothetical protein